MHSQGQRQERILSLLFIYEPPWLFLLWLASCRVSGSGLQPNASAASIIVRKTPERLHRQFAHEVASSMAFEWLSNMNSSFFRTAQELPGYERFWYRSLFLAGQHLYDRTSAKRSPSFLPSPHIHVRRGFMQTETDRQTDRQTDRHTQRQRAREGKTHLWNYAHSYYNYLCLSI